MEAIQEQTTMQATKELRPGTKCERTFAVERAAVNEEARTVELAFSSEEPYDRWWGREILDHTKKSIRLGRLKSGGPLLMDHDSRDHVGCIESVRIDDDRVGRAVVRFGKSARAEEVWQDVKDGIRRNVSVGYVIHKAQLVETGDEATETYRVSDWEPYEVSLVSVPADATVGVGRAMDDSPSPVISTPQSPAPTQEKHMEDNKQAPVDTAAIEARAAEQAMRRVNDILTIGENHADIGGVEMARAAIKEGTSIADFQTKLLAAKREQSAGNELQFGKGARAKDNLADDPKRGFRNYGEFCADVVRAASGKDTSDRLARAATTFGNESSGPDGGFAVPPEFAREISSIAYAEESLLSRCDNTPVSGNTMTFPKDETTPWGSTGITAAWEGEGAQTTPKKPALGESQLKLRKLKVLVAASDELLADAPAMSSYITRKCGEAVDWKVNDAILNGTGAGMPLGILKAASLVSQAKEAAQAADTIVAANIAKMYARCMMTGANNCVWLANPDAFPQIVTLTLNNNPIWVPNNSGFQGAPNGLLLGRPIVLTDACDTVGDVGDIVCANMAGYRAITKAGGAEFATSMHLWFDQDLMAFRLIFRMDGQPALAAAVTPPNSTVTRSHFVALADRT
jgi:HK97 family phage major capsid protein/HK97 family phage prohead protease